MSAVSEFGLPPCDFFQNAMPQRVRCTHVTPQILMLVMFQARWPPSKSLESGLRHAQKWLRIGVRMACSKAFRNLEHLRPSNHDDGESNAIPAGMPSSWRYSCRDSRCSGGSPTHGISSVICKGLGSSSVPADDWQSLRI